MYAIELLKMIEKFEEKYPENNLSKKGVYFDVTGNSGTGPFGYISSYEIGLEYIKFKTKESNDNRIRIPELKSILEKFKYKKIYIEISNPKFYTKIIKEIPWLELRTNLCHSTESGIHREIFITRKEIKNVKS